MKFKIILLGILSFIIALLATVPMALLLPFIPAQSPVQLTGVSGTIWKGQADMLHYEKLELGQFYWEIQPLAFFRGRLRSSVVIDGNDIQLDSLVDLHWDKSIELSQTHAEIEASFLQNIKQIPVKLGGKINANMTSVLIKDKQLPLMVGQLHWQKGQLISPISLPLGDYSLILKVSNAQQQGTLSSKTNPSVNIEGKLRLDKQDNYQIKVKVKTKKDAPTSLANIIALWGKKEKDGFIHKDFKGNLRTLRP